VVHLVGSHAAEELARRRELRRVECGEFDPGRDAERGRRRARGPDHAVALCQQQLCEKYNVAPIEAPGDLTAGVARNVEGTLIPVNGLRHPLQGTTSGWYLWAGETLSTDPDFFAPIHVRHLAGIRPEVVKYLALPPGWRFLIAGDYEDVWYDASLLDV
jgi:hypothetical protein